MRTFSICRGTLLALAMVTTMVATSQAQVVPYYVEGTGGVVSVPDVDGANDFGGPSIGLHLGAFTYSGKSTLSLTGLEGTWTAVDTQVAANGDEIWLEGCGTITLDTDDFITFTAFWVGEWKVVGGTGRFANAGPGDALIYMEAVNEPFKLTDPVWYFSYFKDGTIDLGRNRR